MREHQTWRATTASGSYFRAGDVMNMVVKAKAGVASSIIKHITKPQAVKALKARANKKHLQGNSQSGGGGST